MQLNMQIFINGSSSYSILSLEFLKELIQQGVDVRLFPLDSPKEIPLEYQGAIQKTFYRGQKPHVHHGAPSLNINHQFNLFHHVGSPRIGYTVLELDDLTELEKDSVLSNDTIITCNNYHREVLSRYHSDVRVVSLGINHAIFNPDPAPYLRGLLEIPQDATVFINVGKFERRKCHREICEAFNRAFDPGDNVHLLMFSDNPFIDSSEWRSFYKNSKMGSQIHLMSKQKTQREIAEWIKNADCMVAPSRAEGFNLPAIESLSCGKHLITTNVTAMADYCSPINSHLIELSSKELAYDPPFFNGSAAWYKWEQKHTKQLADLFSHIHYLKQHNDLKPNWDGVATSSSYSWDTVSRQLIEEIFE